MIAASNFEAENDFVLRFKVQCFSLDELAFESF